MIVQAVLLFAQTQIAKGFKHEQMALNRRRRIRARRLDPFLEYFKLVEGVFRPSGIKEHSFRTFGQLQPLLQSLRLRGKCPGGADRVVVTIEVGNGIGVLPDLIQTGVHRFRARGLFVSAEVAERFGGERCCRQREGHCQQVEYPGLGGLSLDHS